jgi:hypothetical protein
LTFCLQALLLSTLQLLNRDLWRRELLGWGSTLLDDDLAYCCAGLVVYLICLRLILGIPSAQALLREAGTEEVGR